MIVPSTNDRPPQKGGVPSSPPPDSALLMAAATMHQMGRLGPMRPKAPPEIDTRRPKPKERLGEPEPVYDELHPEFPLGGIRG